MVEQSRGWEPEEPDLPEHERDEHRRRSIDPDPEPGSAEEPDLPEHEQDTQREDTASQPQNP